MFYNKVSDGEEKMRAMSAWVSTVHWYFWVYRDSIASKNDFHKSH